MRGLPRAAIKLAEFGYNHTPRQAYDVIFSEQVRIAACFAYHEPADKRFSLDQFVFVFIVNFLRPNVCSSRGDVTRSKYLCDLFEHPLKIHRRHIRCRK